MTALPSPMLLSWLPPASGDYWRAPEHIRVQTNVKPWFRLSTIRDSFRIKNGPFRVAEDPRGSTVRASIQAAGYGSGNAKLNEDVTAATTIDAAGRPEPSFTSQQLRKSGKTGPMKGVVSCHGAPEPVEVSASHASLEGVGATVRATARLDRNRLAVTRKGEMVGFGHELMIDALGVPT